MSAGRRGALAAAGLAVAALGACGGERDRSPATTAAPARAIAPVPAPARRAAVAVVRPRRGASVRPGLVNVTGTADPQQTIRVDAGCSGPACQATVFTGLRGRWRARVRLAAPARSRRLTLRAGYATGARRAARVRFRLAAGRPAPRRPRAPAPRARPAPVPAAAASSSAPPRLVLVGDSLAVGVRGLLPAQLPGWRVEVHGRVGRALGDGLRVLSGLDLPAGAGDGPLVLAASLFTNEEPTHLAALATAVRDTIARAGPRGCAIWATVTRPPQHGVGYAAANRLLEQLAVRSASDGRLVVVPWAEQVAARPGVLRRDRVHPTTAGYALLARLYAQAAQSCL
jgi:hypothetical protein